MIERLRAADRRLLVAGAGVAGVLLGLVLLTTVFGRSSAEEAPGSPPPSTPPAVPESSVAAPVRPDDDLASILAGGHDPFSQNVTVPEAPRPAQGPPPATAPPPIQGPPPAGGSPPTTGPPPAEGLPPSSAQPTLPPGGATGSAILPPIGSEYVYVELRSIVRDGTGVDRAHITVDDQSYTPARGEVFSDGFRLEHLDGTCIEMSTRHERVRLCRPAATP